MKTESPVYKPINLNKKFLKFKELWSPRIIAQMNDYHFKLVKFQGDFIWHSHPETDETFIVVQGELRIDFRDGAVILKSGELFVVPKGKEHKPYAKQECQIMLVEPIGTVNTGNSFSAERTAEDQWI